MLTTHPYPAFLPPPSEVSPLTNTEMEVLKRTYLPDKVIADTMHISYHTVKTHTQNIRKKTGLRDKKEMVLYAFKKGYIN